MSDDYRRDGRHELSVWGQYRLPNGVRRDIVFKDLSETGCRFYDKFSGLREGETISLKIDTLGPFPATVKWNRSGYIGVQFENRLYGPTFDHIRLRLNADR